MNVKSYRYGHFQKDEIEKLVGEMLAVGTIRPSLSLFLSPVLLVRKKDGSWQFCVDYRALNRATIPYKYSISIIAKMLEELHGIRYFSKLYLKSNYHQIRVKQSNIPKTTSHRHSDYYKFLAMLFGLSNSPATFQATINDLFRPYLWRFILVFFNDILVYSNTCLIICNTCKLF